MNKEIRFLSIDPSMANTAFVWGVIKDRKITLHNWSIVRTKKEKTKKIRASSDTISRAKEIIQELFRVTDFVNPEITFAETPSGSQSASGMKSYGMSCAIIALLNPDAIQVTPEEVKKLTVGKKDASKDQMMAWAENGHKYFGFERKKDSSLNKSTMEHVCDAIAIVHAGIQTKEFAQIEPFLK